MRRGTSFVVVLVALGAAADVPLRLGYQGRLTAMDGTPVSGPQSFTFSLFVAPTGGAAVWSETQSVLVSTGLYAATLGDVSGCDGGACSGIPASVFGGGELYLEVSVAGVPMVPRQRVTSVPYAVRARDVSGGEASVSTAAVSGNLTVNGQARIGTLHTSGGAPVIDSSGKYVGPALISAVDGGGVLVSPSGAVSLPSCPLEHTLRTSAQGWSCVPSPVDAGLVVYLCPSVADSCNGNAAATPCGGQLTTATSCSYHANNVAGSCVVRTASCTEAGRLNGL